MLKYLAVLIALCPLTYSANNVDVGRVEEYNLLREKLFQKEQEVAYDYTMPGQQFSRKELQANDILEKMRQEELAVWNEKHLSLPEIHFFESKKSIAVSPLFKTLQKMPKGGMLHAHAEGMLNPFWLIRNATYYYECFITSPSSNSFHSDDEPILFRFSTSQPPDHISSKNVKIPWVRAIDARKVHPEGPEAFDRLLFMHQSMWSTNPNKDFATIPDVWRRFQNTFISNNGLFTYIPVYRHYILNILRQMMAHGTNYIELRMMSINQWYDLEGNVYCFDKAVEIANDIVEQFKLELKSHNAKVSPQNRFHLWGIKFIYSAMRDISKEKLRDILDKAISLKKKHPDMVAGFDLVGFEDGCCPLNYFKEELLEFKARLIEEHVDLPFILHAGETLSLGSDTDNNVYDAILLNSTRIGHGLSLKHHPLIKDLVKKKGVAIEVSPISNQLLKYIKDFRNHPIGEYVKHGLPVVLSSDDPGPLCYNGFTYDFFIIYTSFESFDLGTLKKFVKNSIQFSRMSMAEKLLANEEFNESWNVFIDSILYPDGVTKHSEL